MIVEEGAVCGAVCRPDVIARGVRTSRPRTPDRRGAREPSGQPAAGHWLREYAAV